MTIRPRPNPTQKNENEKAHEKVIERQGQRKGKGKSGARAAGRRHLVSLLRRHHRVFDGRPGHGQGRRVEALQHLADATFRSSEFEEAQELAREKSDEVKQLYERFGKELSAYPQFSQFTLEDDPQGQSGRAPDLPRRQARPELSAAPRLT